MAYDSNEKRNESVYSQRVRAGKRRTYFFDVRETRGNDFYLTITESRKKFNEDGYDRHKIFLYKEDFNKFLKGITEAIDHVKTELMPDFDFDVFNHDNEEGYRPAQHAPADTEAASPDSPAPDETIEGSQGSETSPADTSGSSASSSSGDVSDASGSPSESSGPQDESHRDEHVDKW